MDAWLWPLLVAGGVSAGMINTLAGGGSLITVPLLILLGLEPNVANGTNRIAIVAQSGTSVTTFARRGYSEFGRSARLLPVAVLGAALGAYLATIISNDAFRVVFGVLMWPMALLVVFKPRLARGGPDTERGPVTRWPLYPLFFGVGVYAGFIQAGYGLLALAALTLVGGLDLVRANVVKVVLNLAMAAVSIAIFATQVELDYVAGFVLAAAMALGGYLGTLAAIKRGASLIRPVVLIACVALSLRLLFG